jgi:FAD/FMN-containing dehydrogenase
MLDEGTVEEFKASLGGELIQPNDAGYDDARKVWNAMIDKRPALIARCSGTADVITAVNFAREHDLLLSVRGGGHNIAGSALCDDGLTIDLSGMKGLHVDLKTSTVRAQPGCRLGDLDRETQIFGLAVPAGIVTDTGIAGLTLGGGFGYLTRRYGYTCDNLLSADVVTADRAKKKTLTSSGDYVEVEATSALSLPLSTGLIQSDRRSRPG